VPDGTAASVLVAVDARARRLAGLLDSPPGRGDGAGIRGEILDAAQALADALSRARAALD
jgi:hypothetical protein